MNAAGSTPLSAGATTEVAAAGGASPTGSRSEGAAATETHEQNAPTASSSNTDQAASNPETLVLRLKSKDLPEIHFRVKWNRSLEKMMRVFSERVEKPLTSLIFKFDDRRIEEDQTPETLSMQDNDVVEVYQIPPPIDMEAVD